MRARGSGLTASRPNVGSGALGERQRDLPHTSKLDTGCRPTGLSGAAKMTAYGGFKVLEFPLRDRPCDRIALRILNGKSCKRSARVTLRRARLCFGKVDEVLEEIVAARARLRELR